MCGQKRGQKSMLKMFAFFLMAMLVPSAAIAQDVICAPPKKGEKAVAGAKPGCGGASGGAAVVKNAVGKAAKAEAAREAAEKAAAVRKDTWDGTPGSDIHWVEVIGGMFEMGSKFGDSDERPPHQVLVSGFKMAATEVTVRQYRRCVEAGACTLPDKMAECTYWLKKADDLPINCVDWDQAQAYSKWVGGRLPTEAEWEYAARYGQKAVKGREMVMSVEDFATKGKSASYSEIEEYAWYNSNSGDKAHVVATKKPTDIGLYDMLGNMMEWVSDWFGDYMPGSEINPPGAGNGYLKILRGGGYAANGWRVRASVREHAESDTRGVYVGFRPILPYKTSK